ncbi:hypothetical protein AB7W42_22290 [Providencia rettgeri]
MQSLNHALDNLGVTSDEAIKTQQLIICEGIIGTYGGLKKSPKNIVKKEFLQISSNSTIVNK